jgi:hypothetical protein
LGIGVPLPLFNTFVSGTILFMLAAEDSAYSDVISQTSLCNISFCQNKPVEIKQINVANRLPAIFVPFFLSALFISMTC